MKLNFKRLIAIFLSIMMVVGMLPTMVFAADDENGNVAKIGNTEYATLAAAIDAAQDGDTIKLHADAELAETTNIKKNISIDGNGYKLTQTADFAGNGSNALLDISGGVTVTFENLTFDAIKNVAIMRTVYSNVVMDKCVVQNCEHTAAQGLLRLLGDATITHSKFLNNNCTMVITFCYDDTKYNEKLTIDNCEFSDNSCNETAVIYFTDGLGAKITNTSFSDNTVTSTSNVATIYFGGAGNDYEVSNCTFKDNKVSTSASWVTKIASAIYCNGGTVNKNVFDSNTATRVDTAISNVVYVTTSAWNKNGATDLGENYWGGKAPVPGVDYTVDSANNHAVTVADYYASYSAEEGLLEDKNDISYVAKVGNYSYTSLDDAFNAAKSGDTVILTGDVTITENKAGIQIPNGVTFDGGDHTVTLNCYTGSYTTMAHFWNVNADANVKIQNINFSYNEGLSGDALALADATLENVNVTMNGGRFALVVSNKKGAEIELNGCTFTDNVGNYNIATDGNELTTLKIDGCTFNAQNYSLILRTSDSSVKNSTFNGKLNLVADDVAQNVTGNTFNDRVKLYTDNETLTGNSFGEYGYVAIDSNDLTDIDVSGNYWGSGAPAEGQVPEGVICNSYYTALNDNGTIKKDSLTTVAPAVTYVAFIDTDKDGKMDDGETGYATLQAAIDDVQNGDTIELLADITENVTLTEKVGLYYTIDGQKNTTMNGTITVKALSDSNDNRRITIKNINFVDTADAKVDFISSVDTNHYPRLTIEGCSFTGSCNDGDVAIRLKSSNGAIIKDCTGIGLHSFLQNTSGWNLTVENVTVSDSKGGLALGTVQGVTVKNCDIEVDTYGIRIDAQYNNNAEINSCEVEAFIPVVVRNAEVESSLKFEGTNTMTATNTDGYWCAIGSSEYDTNGTMPTDATGKVTVTLNDTNLAMTGVYGAYEETTYVAKVGETGYTDLQEAIKAAAPNGTVEVLADVTVDKWIMFAETLSIGNGNLITLNINGLTINGNNHTLTVNSIESAGNGNRLFYDAQNLNIKDLTIKYADGLTGGIGLQSGTISNVTFEGGGYGVLPGTGEVTITGCTFATNSTAIYYEDARDNLVVTGNTFDLDENVNVILLRGATQFTNNNIESGRTVNVVSGSPVVTGNDFNNVRLKVYTAAEATISGNTINVLAFEDGATTQNSTFSNNTMSDEAKTALAAVTPYVAQIGETKYETLADAIAAANANDTITILANITLTEGVTIPADKTITLDLNGKTISQTKAQTEAYQMILNDGNLTIKDSVGNGKISYTDSGKGGEYVSNTITNRGTLTLESGTIENLSSATVAANGYPHAVDTDSRHRDTSVTINGGTIYCAAYSAIRMFCTSATNKADLTINDGATIKGAVDMQNGSKVAAIGTLTINGGTFETTANTNNIRFANWNGGATEYGITASINGGSFNGGITTAYVPAAANWNSKIITGGTFSSSGVSEYLAEGYTLVKNNDGTYGVEKASTATPVAQVGETQYETLQAAINNANGETVTLIADTTENITIEDNATIVLDLNGKTLNGYIAPCKPTSLTVKNGSIKNIDSSKSAIEVNAGKLTLTNVNIESARHAVRIDGAVTATIDGGTYKLISTSNATQHVVNVSGNATVTIKNGTFVGPAGTISDSGCAVFTRNPATVIIEGGDFSGGKNATLGNKTEEPGTLTVKGGTFDQNPSAYVAEGYEVVENNGIYSVVYVPDLPTASVTEIENEDLTFAMNFKADEVTEAQLAYYGDWYADFVLTVNKDVTFNADGRADGYLSGQYDAWLENWVNVPFEDVILKANEPLKIMEYAAKLMNASGLKLTYNDVYSVVKDFNCGVLFTDEFLEANPDLEVTLELRMYNPEDETESYVIGETYKFTTDYVAMVCSSDETRKGYTTVSAALKEAEDGDTVMLIKDAASETVIVPDNVTLDINGKTLTADYIVAFGGYIIDSCSPIADETLGKLVVPQTNLVLREGSNKNYLPVWDEKESAYYLVSVVYQIGKDSEWTENLRYAFRFDFAGRRDDLEKQVEENESLSVGVRISWITEDGKIGSQNFVLPKNIIHEITNNPKYASLTVKGLDTITAIDVCAWLHSTAGIEVIGGEMKFTANKE